MITVTRRLEFDAGHRLVDHGGKCANVHGHRYLAEITCQAKSGLDSIGRVIDFSEIKQKVGQWIDEEWDHNMILNIEDPLLDKMCWATCTDVISRVELFGRHPYIMPCNPTAENMARCLFEKACELLQYTGIIVVGIRLYETPNCFADYIP